MMMRSRPTILSRRLLLALLGVAGLLAAPRPGAAQTEPKLQIVATFSILGDIVTRIAGERATVTVLVGPGEDAHSFQPKPAHQKAVGTAQLIFANGLDFDNWIRRLTKAAKASAPIVAVSPKVQPLKAEHNADGHHHDIDPHAWGDPKNAILYAQAVASALTAADPAGRAGYEQRLAAYTAELQAVDAEIRALLAPIPPARRRVVTSHDAFAYFGRAYDLHFIAPQGVSTANEASARDVARIVRQIKAENIPAVFLETITNQRLAEQIARETGARIGGSLFSDSLSPVDGPAPTYIELLRHNAQTLAAALR